MRVANSGRSFVAGFVAWVGIGPILNIAESTTHASGSAPGLFLVVEFPGVWPYSRKADEFVRQVFTVCTPAGGEMSGLTAHFLFGANYRMGTPGFKGA